MRKLRRHGENQTRPDHSDEPADVQSSEGFRCGRQRPDESKQTQPTNTMTESIPSTDPKGFVFPEAKAAVEAQIVITKELRRDIDGIIQRLKLATGERNNPPIPTENQRRSRERSLAITKLQEAVMWLGMDLKAIAEENPGSLSNPYPNSKDPSNTVIEPTADGLKL